MSQEPHPPEEKEEALMPISPARASALSTSLNRVLSTINSAPTPPRLVLVSKLKPANDILHLHSPSPSPSPSSPSPSNSSEPTHHPPQSHFGENYYQELLSKSRLLPPTIRWHFIGALQSNKCRPMAEQIPNLWAVESVDSEKKARELEKGRAALVARLTAEQGKEPETETETEKLNIFIQINTSDEATKSGLPPPSSSSSSSPTSSSPTTTSIPPETLALAKYIRDSCPHLHLRGLMTIGAIARSHATVTKPSPTTVTNPSPTTKPSPENATATNTTPQEVKEKEVVENEDFTTLSRLRDALIVSLGSDDVSLELSMGMSADYESAIRCGSDEIRVGSTVFGERPSRQDAKVKEEEVAEEKA
ncbi:MAG: hypothetical protein Q9202_006265 [Teloschistes flavicans]